MTELKEKALEIACEQYFSNFGFRDEDYDTYEEFLNAYAEGDMPRRVEPIVWEPFEWYDPAWIVENIIHLANEFIRFHEEANQIKEN